MKESEEIVMAYIAGLIDGDGSLSLIREKRANGYKFYPCIQLSNVFKDMIDFLYQTFGGCKKVKSSQSHAKKTQYVWNVRGLDSCKNVIEKILPFLVLKKKQAKVLLSYIINPTVESANRDRLTIQSLNNESLVNAGSVVKQASKDTDDVNFWAYFAGILDTEGSFSVRKNKPSCGSKVFKYRPMIQLSMASFESMNFIRQNTCLGRVCFPKAKTTQRGFTYKFSISKTSECIEAINKTIPFLRFKKNVALELRNFCENYTRVKYCKTGVPEKEIEFRHGCYQKIKQLNENEVYKPTLIDLEG